MTIGSAGGLFDEQLTIIIKRIMIKKITILYDLDPNLFFCHQINGKAEGRTDGGNKARII